MRYNAVRSGEACVWAGRWGGGAAGDAPLTRSPTMDASTQISGAGFSRARVVLVAENDESNRVLVQQMLSFAGYTCIATSNGHEALRALEQRQVDLALLDLSMPVLD